VLHEVARKAWAVAFDRVIGQARRRVEHDIESDGDRRLRFGAYFYSEPVPELGTVAPAATAPVKRRRRRRSTP
jgi:hypothetical protein